MDWEKADLFCPPQALEYINASIEDVIGGGDAFDIEINVVTGEGHSRWVRILGEGEFHQGLCMRVYGSVQDITARKESELRLQEQAEQLTVSGKRYSELFHMSPLPMWVFDLETLVFMDVNQAAVLHYGYTREEFLSMTILDIRPADELPKLSKVLGNAARSEHMYRSEVFTHIKKNGERVEVQITSSALQFQERPARLALMFDITERNLHQAEIEAQNERLKNIAWQHSHVVRAPLSRLMGLVDLLRSDALSEQERTEILGYIRYSADELDQVIREITQQAVT
ncbi:MAG: PAS domain S-box protein [Chitinophagaceae bacterium]